MTTETTPDLEELMRLIKAADELATTTVATAGAQIRACVEAGEKLAEFRKTIGHGQWLNWFMDHIDSVSIDTARRWMKLAEVYNKGNGINVMSAKSVRQAYQLAGILPEPNDPKTSKGADGVTYLLHAVRLQHALEQINLEQLDEQQRAQLVARLRPIAGVYAALIG
jgi:hypothetical protein